MRLLSQRPLNAGWALLNEDLSLRSIEERRPRADPLSAPLRLADNGNIRSQPTLIMTMR
jgi:hypothetical protein